MDADGILAGAAIGGQDGKMTSSHDRDERDERCESDQSSQHYDWQPKTGLARAVLPPPHCRRRRANASVPCHRSIVRRVTIVATLRKRCRPTLWARTASRRGRRQ